MAANKTFKDFLVEDLDVFFNPEEFADNHELEGDEILCVVVDGNSQNDSGYTKDHEYASQEVFKIFKTVYVKKEDFFVPRVGSVLTLDGEEFYVEEAGDKGGIVRILLSANES